MATVTKVGKRFNEVFTQHTPLTLTLDFDQGDKLVIFSDCHRGVGDDADDFQACEASYLAALKHFAKAGHRVLLLGDIEELWEVGRSSWKKIFQRYPAIYALEKELNEQGRLVRMFGNHDYYWRKNHALLDAVLGPVTMVESVLVDVRLGGASLGGLFLLHGHQGDFWSEDMTDLSEKVVREVWATIQRATDVRSTTWEGDVFDLRGHRDRSVYYDWAVTRDRVVTVTGHTHKAILPEADNPSEATYAQRLATKLAARARASSLSHEGRAAFRHLAKVWRDRSARALQSGGGGFRSAVMNSGCCCYDNGRVTALEFASGDVTLSAWADGKKPVAQGSRPLPALFGELSAPSALNFNSAHVVEDESLGAVG